MAIAEARNDMKWITDYLEELGKKPHKNILYTDSQSVIQLMRNLVYHSNRKHRR